MTKRMSSGSSRADNAVESDEIAEHHCEMTALGIKPLVWLEGDGAR